MNFLAFSSFYEIIFSAYATGYVLTYGQSIIYTWDDPTKPHELICAVIECAESQKKIKLDAVGRNQTTSVVIIIWDFLMFFFVTNETM